MNILMSLCLLLLNAEAADGTSRVQIEAGVFKPLFGAGSGIAKTEKKINAFWLDVTPVSVSQFSEFLKAHPSWSPQLVSSDYADSNYKNSMIELRKSPLRPVTFVSWFVATAYCESKKGRLPTTLEWEYVAASSRSKKNALNDPNFSDAILRWYANPNSSRVKKEVNQGEANYFGVKNILGMNWEWTADFNSFFLSGDNRQDGDTTAGAFCGAGAVGASSKNNYAAFLRYAMRSSLRANYCQENVGFRCAYD